MKPYPALQSTNSELEQLEKVYALYGQFKEFQENTSSMLWGDLDMVALQKVRTCSVCVWVKGWGRVCVSVCVLCVCVCVCLPLSTRLYIICICMSARTFRCVRTYKGKHISIYLYYSYTRSTTMIRLTIIYHYSIYITFLGFRRYRKIGKKILKSIERLANI